MATPHDRDELLDHPLRSAIFEVAQREPGVSVGHLLARLRTLPGRPSLGQGSLSYHLYRLERASLLTSRRSGRNRRLYEAGAPFDPTALSVLQRPKARELARLVHEGGWITQRELRNRVGWSWSRQALAYHLRHLERAGLLASQRRGRPRYYSSTPCLEAAMAAAESIWQSQGPATGEVPLIGPGVTTPPGLSLSVGQPVTSGN